MVFSEMGRAWVFGYEYLCSLFYVGGCEFEYGFLYRVVPRNGVRIAQHRKGGKSLSWEKSAGRYCEKVSVRCHTPQRPLVGTGGCFDSASLARPVFVEVHVTPSSAS